MSLMSSTTPAPQPATPPRRNLWLLIVAGIALLALGVWLVTANLPKLLTTPDGNADENAAFSNGRDARKIQATLFYASDDGGELVAMGQEVLYGATPAEQMRHVVEAAVAAPPEGRRSAIPAGTTVRSVFLTGEGQAYVDLGGTIVSGHSGGSLDEALAIYAIVNAITVNLPKISAVQILIEGQQVDTLAGHLDLRYPLAKALDWVRKGQ